MLSHVTLEALGWPYLNSIWRCISCSNDVMNHVDFVIHREFFLQKMHLYSKNSWLYRFLF